MSEQIIFDVTTFKKFQKVYNQAVKDNQEQFEFEDKTFLVSYAKYVIEYLNSRFRPDSIPPNTHN